MIHKQHIKTNAAYNAATNLVIEYFGGPQALSELIHRRFPRAQELKLARYMLADRKKHDDNLHNAHTLAAILAELANSSQPDLLRSEIRTVLWLEKDDMRGGHYYKGGSLSFLPQVLIEAGWWEKIAMPASMLSLPTTRFRPVASQIMIKFAQILNRFQVWYRALVSIFARHG
ncbi:MAG: hypothetical protein JKX72_08245 [Robiginitomaculum sp.]|nr:hypothetical protein [Robiginitomaculum sp.]